MRVYYNEIDPFAAAWLRELMKAELIPVGEVDTRSIKDVQANDLRGYEQAHFFAGIGGWPYALQLAGWGDRPVWSGSCPCQPFSAAGKRKGAADERHLWPDFHRLIAECRPATIFGEQVASKDGRLWLAGVRTDLEALAYAVGAADLCAAGVGAPHIRQRLYWVADTHSERHSWQYALLREEAPRREPGYFLETAGSCAPCGLAHTERAGRQQGRVAKQPGESISTPYTRASVEFGRRGHIGYWSTFDALPCTDGKTRRIEPGSFPLAHGVPARVGRLRGYGNAISPPLAAEFIGAYLDALRS